MSSLDLSLSSNKEFTAFRLTFRSLMIQKVPLPQDLPLAQAESLTFSAKILSEGLNRVGEQKESGVLPASTLLGR